MAQGNGTPPDPPLGQQQGQNNLEGMTAAYSVVDMPMPGSKHAPKKFRGHYSEIEYFLEHYENLCRRHSVNDNAVRCRTIRQYCSKAVRRVIEGLDSYREYNWPQLKEDLKKLYDHDLNDQRYNTSDLKKFVKRYRKKPLTSKSKFLDYHRKFITIGGWLSNKGRIEDKKTATYFWQGIHKNLRQRLEGRLIIQHPTHSLRDPFPIKKVVEAAEFLLERNRFDRMDDFDDEEDSDDEGSEDGLNGSESDDSDDDSDDEDDYPRRTEKGHSKGEPIFNSGKKARKVYQRLEKEGMKAAHQDEVESLIKKLGTMSINDPDYALLYYRTVKMDKDAAKALRLPSLTAVDRPRNEMPSSSPSRVPPAYRNNTRNSNSGNPDEMQCFGCGTFGHGVNSCSKVDDYLGRGILSKDNSGKLIMKDGSRIYRKNGEPICDAADRLWKPQVNFITYTAQIRPEEDSHDEYEESEGGDSEYEIYPVTRSQKSITERRKEVFDGVHVPPLRKQNAPAQQKSAPPGTSRKPPSNIIPSKPSPKPKPLKQVKFEPVPVHTPVDVAKPYRDYNPDDDDAIMEDVRPSKKKLGNDSRKDPQKENVGPTQEKKTTKIPRYSDIARQVSPYSVLNKVLNTKLEMQVGDILGVSKDVSQLLSNVLKTKQQTAPPPVVQPANIVAHSFSTRSGGRLIKLRIECDGHKMEGILDTGSQLNVCSRETYKSCIHRPIDMEQSLVMNDANGGEGLLKGLVHQVPLQLGNIMTTGDIWVKDESPFALLLGRPWQRGNLVSIDERPDGTYLLFKDPRTLNPRYEVLVEQEDSRATARQAVMASYEETTDTIQNQQYEDDDDLERTLALYANSELFAYRNSGLDQDNFSPISVYTFTVKGPTEAKIPAENQQEPRRTIPTRQGTPKPSSQKNKDGKVLTWLSEVEQGQSSSNTVASTTEDNIGTKIPPQKSTSITPQAIIPPKYPEIRLKNSIFQIGSKIRENLGIPSHAIRMNDDDKTDEKYLVKPPRNRIFSILPKIAEVHEETHRYQDQSDRGTSEVVPDDSMGQSRTKRSKENPIRSPETRKSEKMSQNNRNQLQEEKNGAI